jgi:hypothetical protein
MCCVLASFIWSLHSHGSCARWRSPCDRWSDWGWKVKGQVQNCLIEQGFEPASVQFWSLISFDSIKWSLSQCKLSWDRMNSSFQSPRLPCPYGPTWRGWTIALSFNLTPRRRSATFRTFSFLGVSDRQEDRRQTLGLLGFGGQGEMDIRCF